MPRMIRPGSPLRALVVFGFAASAAAAQVPSPAPASAPQGAQEPFVPQVGREGRDVVWVPTPFELVERMLDLADVTSQDVVIDLGSGDGRNVIGAAKRGARALGVEYDPRMVALSRRLAAEAGVADRATFVEGDMFQADISQATVLALFLLPSNMNQLRPKFLGLQPGSRIVANTFGVDGWSPDETIMIEGDCGEWCTALLWIVPAKVGGAWQLEQGELVLNQDFQMVTGSFAGTPIADGRVRGEQIRFTVGAAEYTGRVAGDRIEGTVRGGGRQPAWTATRR